jgi:hypothetical protein
VQRSRLSVDAVYPIFGAQELDVDQAELMRVFLKKTIIESRFSD